MKTRVFQAEGEVQRAKTSNATQRSANLRLHCFEQRRGARGILGSGGCPLVEPLLRQAKECGVKRPALDQEDSHFDASASGLRNEPCVGHTHQPVQRIIHRRSPDPCLVVHDTPPSLGEAHQGLRRGGHLVAMTKASALRASRQRARMR